MNILLDTNVLLIIVRSSKSADIIRFLNPDNVQIYVSVASEAEIKSIAFQNGWGENRIEKLDDFLDQVNIVEINQLYINTYIEIDGYSQQRNPFFKGYTFKSPRNMGKNDLWIASLAALLGLKLITTDSDFDHLDKVFCEVKKIEPEKFKAFF